MAEQANQGDIKQSISTSNQSEHYIQKWRISLCLKSNHVAIIIGVIVGFICLFKYSDDSLTELRRSQSFLFKVFLVPPIIFEMKDIVIIERMGTIALLGIFQPIVKITICTIIFALIQLFSTWHECLLLSISLFATENFYLTNNMGESGMSQKKIIFMQSEALTVNVFLVIVSYTFHPFAVQVYMQAQNIMFRLFANMFFTVFIGLTWAFLTSYSLKQSYQKLSNQFDNFDIIMMILAPIVSYLMAETFTISGFLALISCAFIQSIYSKKNLEKERSQLLLSAFRALSYSCRSICDILMGIGFALHFPYLRSIGPIYIVASVIIIQGVTFGGTWLVNRKMHKMNLINDLENRILLFQNNTRGMLCYTLALQNFNVIIVSITLINIMINSMILEPIFNYLIFRIIKQEKLNELSPKVVVDIPSSNQNNDSQDNIQQFGCFKSCLLNLHFFTLSNWLVKNTNESNSNNLRFINAIGNTGNFEKFEDSIDTQASQQIELSRLSYQMKKRSNHTVTGTANKDNDLYQRTGEINEKGKKTKKKKGSLSDTKRSEVSVDLTNREEMKLKFSVFQ